MKKDCRRLIFSVALGIALVAMGWTGCTTTGKKPIVQESKQVQRDFLTCKDVKEDGTIVDATSEFSWTDGRLFVLADLEEEQVGNRLDFEISSPDDRIIYYEKVKYEEDRPYGYYFDTYKMHERGGAGEWKVLFWADGEPVGKLTFYLEGPEQEDAYTSTGNLFEDILGEEAEPEPVEEEEIESATPEATPTPEFILHMEETGEEKESETE